jgi:[ribosomal protein S5]-alanine N-acetyltransferase
MAFLRSVSVLDAPAALQGNGLHLRMPVSGDYLQWAELRARSRTFLVPWEPTWAPDELTRGAFRRRIRQYQKELREETGYAFFIFRSADHCLLGGLSLTNVRRGVTQSCTLGYWMGAPHAGNGYMSEAVRTLAPFVFGHLWLHRLEAACLPENLSSQRVLERNQFVHEGLARRYLKINGQWQDHYLYARVSDEPGRSNWAA